MTTDLMSHLLCQVRTAALLHGRGLLSTMRSTRRAFLKHWEFKLLGLLACAQLQAQLLYANLLLQTLMEQLQV